MNTKDIAAEYRLSRWTQVMRERIESGLSIRAFCKKTGIHDNTYFYWQKKLREAACEQLKVMHEGARSSELIRSRFVEVRREDRPLQITQKESAMQGSLTMEVSGITITADSTYPVSQIAYLLRELAGKC